MTQYNSVNAKLSDSQLKISNRKRCRNNFKTLITSNHQIWLVILVMELIVDINYY